MAEKTSPFPGAFPGTADRGEPESTGRESGAGAVARRSRLGLVPADYAEKTMSSLMSLHEDLMAEKERALEVTRRLMSAQQDRAELEAYVRLLEAELQRRGGPAMGSLRVGEKGGLTAATETVLRRLAGPVAPAPATPAAAPPAPTEAPLAPVAPQAAPVTTAEAPAEPPAEAPPRPPRPSATYRAPVATAGGEVEAGEARSPAAATDAADGEVPARTAAEGWRQW